MYLFLVVLLVALASYDAVFTIDHLKKFPIASELNTAIRFLTQRFGIIKGTLIGILGPTAVIGLIGLKFPYFLTFVVGMRTTLFSFQLFRKHGISSDGV